MVFEHGGWGIEYNVIILQYNFKLFLAILLLITNLNTLYWEKLNTMCT